MSEWYCHNCPLNKGSPHLGPWGDEDKESFKNILLTHGGHDGFSTKEPEKTLEQHQERQAIRLRTKTDRKHTTCSIHGVNKIPSANGQPARTTSANTTR